MRKKQLLIKEIVEANAVKSAYNWYLASDIAKNQVENTTQVKTNLKTISVTLRRLHTELQDLNNKRLKDERREIIDREVSSGQCSVGSNTKKQQQSAQTANAIMLFNADARFRITE